jgi:hypothetical protein
MSPFARVSLTIASREESDVVIDHVVFDCESVIPNTN